MADRVFVPFNEKDYVSNSSVSTYNQCQMKFYKQYIEGKEDPPSPAQKLGTAWHSIIDRCVELNADSYLTERLAVDQIMDPWIENAQTEDDVYYAINWKVIFGVLIGEYIRRYGLDDRREAAFNIPGQPKNISGVFDGISPSGIAEDKLLTRHYFNATAIAALNTNQQIFLYLWAARELGIAKDLEYRVTLKPTINMRRKQKPETSSDYEERLMEDVLSNPGSYFWSRVYRKTDKQLDDFMREFTAARNGMIRLANNEEYPTTNRSACSMYGGCKFIGECT